MSNRTNTASGANPSHAIPIDETDTDSISSSDTNLNLGSDSEDGGMQLDDPPQNVALFRQLMRQEEHVDSDTHALMLTRGDGTFTLPPTNLHIIICLRIFEFSACSQP